MSSTNIIIIITIIMNFYSPVFNSRCHSIGHTDHLCLSPILYVSHQSCTSLTNLVRLSPILYVSHQSCMSLTNLVHLSPILYISYQSCTSLTNLVHLSPILYISHQSCVVSSDNNRSSGFSLSGSGRSFASTVHPTMVSVCWNIVPL